jgi:FkbH-like protein
MGKDALLASPEFAPAFHHIGIAVRDIPASRSFFCGALGMEVDSDVVVDPNQRVRLQMLRSGASLVELVQPLTAADVLPEAGGAHAQLPSPIEKILKERDESMYHFCLEVDNLEDMLRKLVSEGKCTIVSQPTPAPLFGMRKVAFVFVHETNNLVEFLERGVYDELTVPVAAAPVVAQPKAVAGKIVVSSTFTADPIADILSFWSETLHIEDSTVPHEVVVADFNSVFQQLLQPASDFAQNTGKGMNVVVFRFDDFLSTGDTAAASPSNVAEALARATEDFCNALEAYFKSMGQDIPLFVVECKPSPAVMMHHKTSKIVNAAATKVQALMEDLGKEGHKAFYLPWAGTDEMYPLPETTPYYSAASDKMASLPYTDEYFCAVGTALMRCFWTEQNRESFKAFVMDCDNTLWEGVVSEESPASLAIKGSFVDIQTILKQHRQKGRLVCLASMNDEKDVMATFDQRADDMVLSVDDIAAHKINWNPKVDNIADLATDLNLGLDSFVFVDDDPLNVESVAGRLPEVLAVQMPQESEEARLAFLRDMWAFDVPHLASKEDSKRTDMYKQNFQRESLRKQSGMTFVNFIESLNLSIDVQPLQQDKLQRTAQMTQRTNRFNTTTIRRTGGNISYC